MAEDLFFYVDRYWATNEYPKRAHLLHSGLGEEVRDVREDISDAFTRISQVLDRGSGHGGASKSGAAPSENISGGTDTTFKINVDGSGAVDVVLANVATLNSAVKIVAAMNYQFERSSSSLVKMCKAYWFNSLYWIIGPYDPDGGVMSVVITNGAAHNVADDLKIGVANGGTEGPGVLSSAMDPSGLGAGTDNIINQSGVAGATASAALDQLDSDIGALGTDDIANDSGVAGATASAAINQLDSDIGALGTDDIANNSGVVGATTSDALNQLNTDLGDRIVGSVAAVDLKDAGASDYTIALGGTAGKRFVPTKVAVRCTAAVALAGDAKIKIGTALGGEQVAAEITLTGLDLVDEVYIATPADGIRAVAADATIHVQVSSADSGTSGAATVSLIGFEV